MRQQRLPEQQVRAASQLRGSVLGGGAQAPAPVRGNVGNAPDVDMTTLNALRSLGDSLINPLVERRQKEEFMAGARRQIEGEALKDIVDSQPWYTRIFGPSASIQGARTLAQMQAVEAFSTEIDRDMANLRALSPDEFGNELMARMDRHSELGDTQSNIAVQAQLMENYGPLVRSHTKEHHAYIQEQMQQQFTGALASTADFLGQAMQGVVRGTMSQEDAGLVMQSAAAALQPIEGQTADSYWAGVQVATEEAMTKGNFHFVNLVEQNLYEHMPADQRVKFNNDRRKYEIQTASDMAVGEFSLVMAQLKAQSAEGLISPDATWNQINQLNQTFRARTGIDRDFIDAGQAEGILTNNLRGIIQERRRAVEAAQDAQARQREIEQNVLLAKQAYAGGYAGNWVDQGANRQEVQAAAWSTIQQQQVMAAEGMAEPDLWAEATVANHVNDQFEVNSLRDVIRGGARASIGSELSPAFMQSYTMWEQLHRQPKGGPGVARAYAGEYAGQFEQYRSLVQDGAIDPNIAFSRVFSEHPNRSPANQDTTKAIMEYVRGQTEPGWWRRTFGAEPMTEAGQRFLATRLASRVADMEGTMPGASIEGTIVEGWQAVKGEVEIIGKHPVDLGNRDNVRIHNYLGRTEEESSLIFDSMLRSKMQESGISNYNRGYQIERAPDAVRMVDGVQEREPRYFVFMEDDEFIRRNILITGEELRNHTYVAPPATMVDALGQPVRE